MNIPGYQLGREISSNEFCSVYNALEIESSKTVTVKFFHPQLSKNPEFCQHLKITSQLLLNKSIGNIIPVKVAETNPEGCYLVTGYFPCIMYNQPLPFEFSDEEILNFGLQIADSLTKFHAMGLVHGAVSTFNLVFQSSSQVTLGLMSFQRTIKQKDLHAAIPLSIDEASYIAPEFFAGKSLDARSDFYSLGVVLFELLFKSKPFIADSLPKLLFKKVQMIFADPNIYYKELDALFDKLLAPNPAQRIDNVNDYIKIVEQCGYKINKASAYKTIPSSAAPPNSETKNSVSKTNYKNTAIYLVAGLLMVVMLSFFMFSKPFTNKEIASIDQPLPGTIEKSGIVKTKVNEVIPQADLIAAVAPVDNNNIANELYLKSQQQILQNDYNGALISIDNSLKEKPGHSKALELKNDIKLEIKVRTYLSRAENLIQQGNLTQPANDNAFETYKKVKPLLSVGDNRGREILEKIANQYYWQANDLVLQKKYANAKQLISTGLTVVPDFIKLKQLDQYIRQEQSKQLTEQQNKKLQADLVAQKATQQTLKQQVADENKLAALEREKALEMQQQKEREEEVRLQKKRQKIKDLLNSARALLESNQLSVQSLKSSLEIYQQLTGLTGDDSRVVNLFTQIVDSYDVLATNQKNIPELAEALHTVDLGLALDGNNLKLLNLKSEIKQLLSEAEAKQNEVPFVGTF